jgi:hypothetical protein
MKLPDLFVNAIATFDGRALAKGQKQISGFEKGVKSFAKTFGVAFSAAAVVQFGKASITAFAEAEREATVLANSVRNLGLAFDQPAVDAYIEKIGKLYGVTGGQAVPAMQALLTATGSVSKSISIFNTALDVAASTGYDVTDVAQSLSQAYLGNTKSLKKYNTGLSAAELAAADFNDIQKILNKNFAGAATQAAGTYTGQMAILTEQANQAKEIIGKGLVDALMILAGDTTAEEFADTMKEAAENTATLATNLAKIIKTLNTPLDIVANTLAAFIEKTQPFVDLIVEGDPSGFLKGPSKTPGTGARSKSPAGTAAAAKARAKAEADAARREKERLALIKKGQIAEKNKLSLSKAAAVFDTNRISIAAALQATYDKETRLRLEALMAIEDENGNLALQKINELAAFQKNANMDKLKGITEISDATLAALNAQLLAELKVINDSEMAEGKKEEARQIAFGKYNEALTKAGELAAKEQYSERVQIQLTEIARLASLSKTSNAGLVLNKLRESAELDTIDIIAKAQKAADDARYAALLKYIALLKTAGGCDGLAEKPTGFLKSGITMIGKTPFVTGPVIDPKLSLSTVSKTAAATSVLPEYISATEFYSSLSDEQKADLGGYSPYMNSGSGYAQTYNININAGAIAAQDEFAGLIQDTIQRLNRGGDPLTTAGVL